MAIAMPQPDLRRAHQALDKAVDAAYGRGTLQRALTSDAERVAFLFELYHKYTSLLPSPETPVKQRKRQRSSKKVVPKSGTGE
jgi:hypothetical protein